MSVKFICWGTHLIVLGYPCNPWDNHDDTQDAHVDKWDCLKLCGDNNVIIGISIIILGCPCKELGLPKSMWATHLCYLSITTSPWDIHIAVGTPYTPLCVSHYKFGTTSVCMGCSAICSRIPWAIQKTSIAH